MSQQNANDARVPLKPDDEKPVLLEPPAPATSVDGDALGAGVKFAIDQVDWPAVMAL